MADTWGAWDYVEAVVNPIGSTAHIASDLYNDYADARERELEVSAKEREARAKQKERQRSGKGSKGSKSSSDTTSASSSGSDVSTPSAPSLDLVSDDGGAGSSSTSVLAGVDAGTAAKVGGALLLVVVGVAVLARR